MKKLLVFSVLLIFACSCNDNSARGTGEMKVLEVLKPVNCESQTLMPEFLSAALFKITDTIIADFNGDGYLDRAIFKKETSGIVISHGEINQEVRIGFGTRFAQLVDFNWVDFWGLVNDKKTYEVVIKDSEIVGDKDVELMNPSIVLRKDEMGGGLITYKEGKYVWIHQAD